MTVINYRDGVAIGEICFYAPALVIALVLSARHGFTRSSGWIFLVLFSLIRIIGAGFQLATINDPTNVSLYTGVAILQNIGLSPLELTALGLLTRVVASINKTQQMFIRPYHLHFIQIIVMVGLILGIVGGVNASSELSSTGVYKPQTLSKAGIALFLVSYVAFVIVTILISFSLSYAEAGEKRLLLAVALSLPFLLVRLIYSSISTFGNSSSFNTVTGNVTILLCMALIMEACCVVIYEGVGLSLQRVRRDNLPTAVADSTAPGAPKQSGGRARNTRGRGSNIAGTLGRRTMIGRLVTSAMNSGEPDVEMQQQPQSRRQARRSRR